MLSICQIMTRHENIFWLFKEMLKIRGRAPSTQLGCLRVTDILYASFLQQVAGGDRQYRIAVSKTPEGHNPSHGQTIMLAN